MNKEIKELLIEIYSLCLDKGLHFSGNPFNDAFSVTVSKWYGFDTFYIGEAVMVVAEWKESSIDDLENLKQLVIEYV